LENSVKKNGIKSLLKYFNPQALSTEELNKIPFLYPMVISGLTYGLFFLQTGLDQKKAGSKTLFEAMILAIKGLGIGTFGLIGLSVVVFVIMKIFKSEYSLSNLVKACCLSYTTALLSLTIGLILNIFFHANTAVAFGITGVLWSLNPLFRVFRKNTRGNFTLSLIL
jgi:hypothetical protein